MVAPKVQRSIGGLPVWRCGEVPIDTSSVRHAGLEVRPPDSFAREDKPRPHRVMRSFVPNVTVEGAKPSRPLKLISHELELTAGK